jgi:gamma-glutamyltranspeptidase/glutathione hydrolase
MEPDALPADTVQALQARRYRLTEQSPWGAAELIVLPEHLAFDSAQSAGMRPGLIYGANDRRRPAGQAIGY